jgi:plasmid stabilization system protein ParE
VNRTVKLSTKAREQAHSNATWWAEHHSVVQAIRWASELEKVIHTLQTSADRFPVASEADEIGLPIRQLNFGIGSRPTHRVVFSIDERFVFVHGVYHASQRPLRREDFDSPTE